MTRTFDTSVAGVLKVSHQRFDVVLGAVFFDALLFRHPPNPCSLGAGWMFHMRGRIFRSLFFVIAQN